MTTLVVVVVGVPLGIIAGRLTWIRFAQDTGVGTTATVPLLLLVAIGAFAVALGCVWAIATAAVVGRAPTAPLLRAE